MKKNEMLSGKSSRSVGRRRLYVRVIYDGKEKEQTVWRRSRNAGCIFFCWPLGVHGRGEPVVPQNGLSRKCYSYIYHALCYSMVPKAIPVCDGRLLIGRASECRNTRKHRKYRSVPGVVPSSCILPGMYRVVTVTVL